MAGDTSRDPVAQAQMQRLEAELVALRQQFQTGLVASETAAAEVRGAARSIGAVPARAAVTEAAAAAEPAVIRQAATGMEGLQAAAERVRQVVEQTTGGVGQLTTAERLATATAKERLAIEEQEVAAIRAAAASIGRSPAGGVPTTPAGRAVSQVEAAQKAAFVAEQQAQAQALAAARYGGAGATTPEFTAPAPPAAPVNTTKLSEISNLTREQEHYLAIADQIPPRERLVSAEMDHTSSALSRSSLAYQQHGALTTEFIAAAAKGQVTIKELGDQMLLTIGKFAGWTAAAAATYGIIGVLGDVGRGATQSATGLQQLERFLTNVDTGRAQDQFRQLSAANNVSIKDAADATAAFAKIFQNQDQAVAAADVALKATQLDQISLADSTRFLTGAIVGFHLPASQLPIVFDQINNAQRRFGASVAQTLAALGGSAAAVRNAGGNFNEYIALVTAAQRATAQTGSVVGTAFRRSASTFVTKAQNQEILRGFGLDPTEAYTQLLLDAVNKAKTLNGQQINKLAVGLGGPQQGARVFAGLLSRPDLVARALDVTSPAKASGSAAEEMAHKLAQADQQIKAVANSLERLGSTLAQTGALSPFLALIGGFREVADVVGNVISLIDKLPGGLGQVLIPLAEVAAGFRLLRNLDLGARLGPTNPLAPILGSSASNGAGLLRPSAERTARKDFEKGYDEQVGYYRELQQNSAKGAARLAASVERQKAYIAELNASGAAEEDRAAQGQRLVALQEQARGAIFEEDYFRRAINELELSNNERLAAISAGMSADQAAAAAGFGSRPGTLNRPSTGVPTLLGPQTQAESEAAALAAEREASQVGLGSALAARYTTAKARLGAAFSAEAIATTEAGAASAEVEAAEGAAITASNEAAAKIGLGAAAMNTLRTSGGIVNGALGSLVSGLTSFTALIIGVPIAIGEINSAIKSIANEAKQTSAAVASVDGPAQLQDQVVQLRALAAQQAKKESQGGLSGALGDVVGFVARQPIINLLTSAITRPGESATTSQLADLGHSYLSLLKQAQTDANDLQGTAAGRQRWHAELAVLEAVARTEAAGGGKNAGALLQSFLNSEHAIASSAAEAQARLAQGTGAIRDTLAALTGSQLDKQITDYANYLKLFGSQSDLGRTAATHLTQILRELASRAAFNPQGVVDKSGTTNLDKFAQGEQTITSAIQQQVSEDLRLALEAAHTKAQRAAAYRAAAANVRTLTSGVAEQVKEQDAYIASQEREAAVLKAEAQYLDAQGREVQKIATSIVTGVNGVLKGLEHVIGPIQALGTQFGGNLTARLRSIESGIKQHTTARDTLQQFLDHADKIAHDQIAALQGQAFNANKPPKTPKTPASEDPFAVERLQREIQKAREDGDPVAQARSDQELAQREIAVARNIHERLQGQLDLVNADNELAKALADQAQAMFTYRESLTTDPVKIAILEYQASVAAVREAERHGGPNTTASLDARAKQNDAHQKLIDARVTASEDTIQFDIDMGKITSETAIREYQALLKVHGLTLATKRKVMEDIKRLQDQSNADNNLNLGSIRLPTAYEIRRATLAATGGGGAGQPIAVTQHYSTSIQVTDTRSANQVGVVFDRYHRGTGKAIARAVGAR